ncbi:MAG: hypothetical protein ABIS45_00525, partial [Burkholderiales bacterium]
LISSFGVFWFGEGIGIVWPFEDAAILVIAAILVLVSRMAVSMARHARLTRSAAGLDEAKP